ncbi:MAG TPA: acyl-CoA dehydrogenase family protein [Rhizomicrobium sp.]|nr:acyl-CoA dehydrogenase family protein [Rhizomicrobium sp.]
MKLRFSEEDEAFRARVRAWLSQNAPEVRRPAEGPGVRAYDLSWQRKLYDGGWAGIHWPTEYGGQGLSLLQQLIWHEEHALAATPDMLSSRTFVGLNHGGPTLIINASEEQKRQHLPRILRGEVVWCQGFSEPGAGSDLAGIRTRGRIEGDYLIVNGQKIWTSFAQDADYQELLVRTDPDASKHAGLTWIICDMTLPGITVRPIRLLTGRPDFCEVFYDDVKIPLENVVGGIGRGWTVAMSTLAFERGTAMTEKQIQLSRTIDRLIVLAKETCRADGTHPIDDPLLRARLAKVRAKATALRHMTYLNISRLLSKAQPGPEGSMIKVTLAQLAQEIYRLGMDIMGADGLLYENGDDGWVHDYLYSYASSIGGGTNEIQNEIIAEKGLGLPRMR